MTNEAVYESKSPGVEQVRNDVLSILRDIKIINLDLSGKDELIQRSILKIIPNNRNDFGSYRGYITFSVGKKIAKEVLEDIKKTLDSDCV